MLNHRANPSTTPASSQGIAEEGYILIGVLVLVALVLIALAAAAPRVATDLQRDKEDELMHRGMQYTRAIRLYYRKFGRFPSNLDQLENTNEIRFLRKRYKDPVSGKDEWRLIHFGEAKVKPTGLFGQPFASVGAAPGASATGTSTPQTGFMSSTFGSSSSSSFGSSGTGLGNSPGLSFGPGTGSPSDSSGGSAFGSSSPTPTGGTGATGEAGSTGSATSGIGGSGIGGQTFGGGGIVGVSSTSTKASIREFKKQKHYNEWEFVYNPLQDQNGLGGQNGTGIQQQPGANNPNSSFGSGTTDLGTSPIGGATSPTPTPAPSPAPTPQQ
ncbi:MAG TPA: hypothetical protein VM554_12175 [Acidisarcina sp.]|nr:hypothetical protein [Acidisarcina sp.]